MQLDYSSTSSNLLGPDKTWFAIRSKPRKEESLYSYLNANQYKVFFPRIRVNPKNPRAAKRKPYFPGYMFIAVDLQALGENTFQWLPFSQGLVMYGDLPAPVPSAVIDLLKKRMQELAKLNMLSQRSSRFKKGQRVRITQGPLSGYSGLFDSQLSGGDRVRVLLILLGNQQLVAELDSAHLIEHKVPAAI